MRHRHLAALLVLPLLAFVPASDVIAASVPTPTLGVTKDVVVQSDGKIVAAFQGTQTDRFTVVRLRSDMSLDPTFGGDGVVESVIDPTKQALINDLAVQPDGRILAAGHLTDSQFASVFAVLRYRPDGSLDPTFGGGDGVVLTDFPIGHGRRPRVALTTGGAIVAAGQDAAAAEVLVARYRADGSPDPAFGTAGTALFDVPNALETVNDVAVDAAGNAVIGGSIQYPFTSPQHMLLRITPAGQLDPTFATGGRAIWIQGSGESGVRGVAIDAGGRVVAAGYTEFNRRETLARFLPSGAPDVTFGSGGYVTTMPATWGGDVDRPGNDVVVLPDGRIAVAGTIRYVGTYVRLAVFRPDGTPDPSFDGGDGVRELPLGLPNKPDGGGFLAITRNGALIVAGTDLPTTDFNGTLEIVAVPSRVPAADLAAMVAASPNPAAAGPVEFTVRVRNDGPQPADVNLTFELSQAIDEIIPRSGACHLTLTYVATCTLGPLAAGQEVAAMSVTTQVTGFEEGLFGTATVTTNAYDPDPTDNSLTTEVLIQSGATS